MTRIVPTAWKNEVMIRVPKKRDLSDCGNWSGIILSPVALKFFNIVVIK